MAPHVATNGYEEAARLRKATKLADYAADLPIEMLEEAGSDFWKTCAGAAGCNPPSDKTIDLAISLIRQRTAASGAPSLSHRERRPAPDQRRGPNPAQGSSVASLSDFPPAAPLSEFPCPTCLDRGVDDKGEPCLECENRVFAMFEGP